MMGIWKTGLLGGCLLLVMGQAMAEEWGPQWVQVFEDKNNIHYDVDAARLTRDTNLVYFWVRQNLDSRLMGEELAESRKYMVVNCTEAMEMELKGYAYSKEGELVGAGENPHPSFHPIAKGSPKAALMGYVCGKTEGTAP